MYGFLADVVVALHVGYVAYVLIGQLAVIVAGAFRARWGRNPLFRYSHLLFMGIVAFEAVMGWRCPLTTWEEKLRALAGQVTASESFVARMMHDVLFIEGMPKVFFTTLYIAMFVVVAQAFVMYPPRRVFGPRSGGVSLA